jgi:hypothetical protein
MVLTGLAGEYGFGSLLIDGFGSLSICGAGSWQRIKAEHQG